jgi:hypothetical protein
MLTTCIANVVVGILVVYHSLFEAHLYLVYAYLLQQDLDISLRPVITYSAPFSFPFTIFLLNLLFFCFFSIFICFFSHFPLHFFSWLRGEN